MPLLDKALRHKCHMSRILETSSSLEADVLGPGKPLMRVRRDVVGVKEGGST